MNTIGLQYAVATFIIGLFVWGGIARISRDSKATKEDDKMSCLMVIVVSIISAIISYFISK